MIAAALIMGIAGSLHCVGMCSPLALTVSRLNPAATFNRLIYNLGRILTYGILGASLGSAGLVLPVSGFQNLISVVMGVALLLVAIMGWQTIRVPGLTPLLQRATRMLKGLFGKFLQKKGHAAVFVLGSLNGILPCGLTLLALAYSITLGSPVQSFLFMIVFGLGTFPVMLGLTSLADRFIKRLSVNVNRITTVMMVISGCLLIARVFIFHAPHSVPQDHSMIDMVLCR